MIFIAHRGNLNGSNSDLENNPRYIDEALERNFNVEVDIWYVNNQFHLGHDNPIYPIDLEWLKIRSDLLWIHCKDKSSLEELHFLNEHGNTFNFFWHENDLVTLTSKGYIWALPGKQPIKNSIAVMPELYNDSVSSCLGICSDFILKYSNLSSNNE
jgi:hypothetical protein